MRFCNFYPPGSRAADLPLPGVGIDDRVYSLADVLDDPVTGLLQGQDQPLPIGFCTIVGNNLVKLPLWKQQVEERESKLATLQSWLREEVRFAPPVFRPTSFRDFYAFEQHVKKARSLRGLDVAPEWYEMPVFYFSNHGNFIADGDLLKAPGKAQWLDYELEIAAVIVSRGRDVPAEKGESLIGGYCVLNDWSLRDVQRKEMAVGLGPAKGKDFATSLGPWLITPDELEDRRSVKGFDLEMKASVNGRLLSQGNWKDIYYSFGEMIERASDDVELIPGDVIGSGTVGSGCILELGPEHTGGWLKPGDEVELEIERLGTLRNTIIKK